MNCPASKGKQHYLSRSEYEFQQRLSWLFGLPLIRPSIPLDSSLTIFDLGLIWGWSCQFALNSHYVGQALRMFANHDFCRTICTNQMQNWLKPNVENHPLSRFKILCPYGRAGSSPASGTFLCQRETLFLYPALLQTAMLVSYSKRLFAGCAIGFFEASVW